MNFYILPTITAFCMDVCIGDPVYSIHPVRLMGKFINTAENVFLDKHWNKKLTGAFTAISLILFSSYPVYILLKYIKSSYPYWGFCAEVVLIYTTISLRDLYEHSKKIIYALNHKNMESSRKYVSMIVGRDTHEMNEVDISRAAVESVAENLVDGVLSPIFYAFIGGAPLALAFKAISTLDSMIGYKNEKYEDFGMVGARLDDIANYIPARLSIILIPLAAFITGYKGWNALKTGIKDGRKNPSPNSGFSEACVAGALEIRLGGPSTYNGKAKEKPYLGKDIKPVTPASIIDSNKIAATSSILFMLIFILLEKFLYSVY